MNHGSMEGMFNMMNNNSIDNDRLYNILGVSKNATKREIKKAVEEIFDVTVLGVHVVKVHGKNKVFNGKKILTPSWKKALITLKLGDTISLVEGA